MKIFSYINKRKVKCVIKKKWYVVDGHTKRQIASSVALLLAMANNDRGVQFSFQQKRWRNQREHNERNTLETSMKQLGLG